MDAFDPFFDWLYNNLVAPLLHGVAALLGLLISPLSGYPPHTQIAVVALFGAVLSKIFSKRFKAKREQVLQQEFKEKISSLGYTKYVGNDEIERVVRKGINESADEVYEKIILDKFFEIGISYVLPLFFFLIWLQYDLFTPEKLKALTGSPYAWVTASGLKLSAAYVYLFLYNILLLAFWLMELAVRVVSKRLKSK